MNIALVLAGGGGARINYITPKQFMILNNRPIIIRTLDPLFSLSEIDNIVVTCHPDWKDFLKKLLLVYGLTQKPCHIIQGGDTRQESSFAGFQYIKKYLRPTKKDIVLITEGVRVLTPKKLHQDCLHAAKKHGAVTSVVPSVEEIMISQKKDIITDIPDKQTCFIGQNPQAFQYGLIYEAHSRALEENWPSPMNEGNMILKMNKPLKYILGDYENIKLTHPVDLIIANETILKKEGPILADPHQITEK